jgi:hypothetical protein
MSNSTDFRTYSDIHIVPTLDGVTTQHRPAPAASITFATVPQGAQVTYVAGFRTFIPSDTNYTPINTAITFTATLNPAIRPVEFRWDFGDGVIAFGNPVQHIYKFVFAECQAVLRVTDDQGQQHLIRQQIYLADTHLLVSGASLILT